jgi:hypothetical protein
MDMTLHCALTTTGSSKGMEAHGALLQSCLHLHHHQNVVFNIIVMDDDSSTENILYWNFAEALTAELIYEIPKTKGGNKKEDKGTLPNHPSQDCKI